MTANFGEAQLKLTVDIPSFRAELGQAMDSVNEWKNALANNLKFDVNAEPLKEIPAAANEGKESVEKLGNESETAISKMANFTLIQGIVNGLTNAFSNVSDYVMGFIKDFGAAELSSKKLENNLKNLGQQDYFSTLIKQAEDLAKITPFDDDDIVNAQAMLGTFKLSGEQIQALTPRMIDLAAAYQQAGQTGMNLQQVAVMIGKGAGTEMVSGLTRVGIVMSETEKEFLKTATGMDKINALTKILDANFKGLGQTLGGTTVGQMQMFENAMENIREEIGQQLMPVFNFFKGILEGLMNVFKELPSTMQLVIVAIVGVGGALAALIPILAALDIASGGTLLLIGAIVTALAGLGGAFIANIDSIKGWVVEMLGGQENVQKVMSAANELWEMLEEFGAFLYDTLIDAFMEVKEGAIEIWDQFGITGEGSGKLLDNIKSLVKEGLELAQRNFRTLIDLVVTIIKEYQNFILRHPDLISAFKSVAEFGIGAVIIAIRAAVELFGVLISSALRAVQAIAGLAQAFEGLGKLNLVDAIFNPGRIDEAVNQIKAGIDKVKTSMTFEGSNSLTKSGNNAGEIVGPPKPEITSLPKTETTGSTGNNKGSGKGGDSDKEADKLEKEMLDDKLQALENELKLAGDVAEKRIEIIQTYQAELAAMLTTLQLDESREKVQNKLVDLQADMNKMNDDASKKQKESTDKNNELIADVTKFIADRQNKILTGVAKETADIEKAYDAMYKKIAASKLTAENQAEQIKLLDTQKEIDLAAAKERFEKQAQTELTKLKLDNEKTDHALKIKNINDRFKREKDDIRAKFGETKTTEDLIKQIEIARVREVQKVQAENQAVFMGIIQAGWSAVTGSIQQGFSAVWESVFGQANSLFEQFVQTVISKLLEIAASELFTTIIDVVSGGAGGGIFGMLGSIFKAKGGRVNKDQPYVVGEEGWEWFIPDVPGYILNNRDAMATVSNQLSGMNSNPAPLNVPGGKMPEASFGGSSITIDLGGVSANVTKKSLTGELNQQEWNDLTDNELVPQISQALKRIGKKVVDDSIKIRK